MTHFKQPKVNVINMPDAISFLAHLHLTYLSARGNTEISE